MSGPEVKDIFYLHSFSLDSLYQQIVGSQERSVTLKSAESTIKKLSTTARFRIAIGIILGNAEASATGSLESNRTEEEQISYDLNDHEKLNRITTALTNDPSQPWHSSYAEASWHSLKNNLPTICLCRHIFDAPQYNARTDSIIIPEGQALFFKTSAHYAESDNYYKIAGPQGEMSLSMGPNYHRGNRSISNSSHEGHYIRRHGGIKISLGFLGIIRPVQSSQTVSIKPIAVWI